MKLLPSLYIFSACLFMLLSACKNRAFVPPGLPGEHVNMQAPYYSSKIPDNSPRITKRYDSTRMETLFPFTMYHDDTYLVALEVEDTLIFEKFNPLFEQYGYTGNGYAWDGIIREILNKEDASLSQHLDFDAEAGGYYVFADCASNQRKFTKLMAGVFANRSKLEDYIKNADKSKIED